MSDVILQAAEARAEVEAHEPGLILPSGIIVQRSAQSVLQNTDASNRSATFVIVTRTQEANRYGNKLRLTQSADGKGPVLNYYNANPVVLYDHGQSGITLPVGTSAKDGAVALSGTESQMIATCYFSTRQWAENVYFAVEDKMLNMASIGFDPYLAKRLEVANPRNPEGVPPLASAHSKDVMNLQYLGLDFTEWELLEWSITPVGADRGAMRQALDRGHIHGSKLSAAIRQSFLQHADEVPKQGIGIEVDANGRLVNPPRFIQVKMTQGGVEIHAAEDPTGDGIYQAFTHDNHNHQCAQCGSKLQCPKGCNQSDDDNDGDNDNDPMPDAQPMSIDAIAQAVAIRIGNQQSIALLEQRLPSLLQSAIASVVDNATSELKQRLAAVEKEYKRACGKVEDFEDSDA